MDDKKQKLAQALRDNLMRRKQQARARAKGDADMTKENTDPQSDGRKKATLSEKSDTASG
ncbi:MULTISPECIES: hypothetical protein [Oceanibaculum]|uniref:hypothetical protein n=1 Tax=Oceanibaculum TaxID=659693 RepID=UPI00059341D8|nr:MULTISPECIES: hypothetical protein [Oceanibaculum]MCH2394572.1 hypothetical protein [Oceanibaculum sp.]